MSTSNRSRSPRAGGKGAAAKKRTKKAKRELHGKKRYRVTAKQVNKDDARKRVVESLEHLGHQNFSKEPGGYDLRGWLKSLKTLLDDFEEKVGSASLTEEFRAKRKEVEAEFSGLGDTSQLESEMEGVRKEEAEIRAKLKEESERIAARLSAIGGEKTSKALELDQERANLKKVEEERRSVSFFSRLAGRSGPSAEPVKKKVADLENGLKTLEEETQNLQTVRKSIDGAKSAEAGIYADLWKKLEVLDAKIGELDLAREGKIQLQHEREEATEALRKIISELKLEEDSKDE